MNKESDMPSKDVVDELVEVDGEEATSVLASFYEVIGTVRALQIGYHHAHANVTGPNFYPDHVLLQRLYDWNSSVANIDELMERFVGVFGEPVRMERVLAEVGDKYRKFLEPVDNAGTNEERIAALHALELDLQSLLDQMIADIEELGEFDELQQGVVDMLQGVANTHQEALYLLGQRLK